MKLPNKRLVLGYTMLAIPILAVVVSMVLTAGWLDLFIIIAGIASAALIIGGIQLIAKNS